MPVLQASVKMKFKSLFSFKTIVELTHLLSDAFGKTTFSSDKLSKTRVVVARERIYFPQNLILCMGTIQNVESFLDAKNINQKYKTAFSILVLSPIAFGNRSFRLQVVSPAGRFAYAVRS